jgi:hypothetical protein
MKLKLYSCIVFVAALAVLIPYSAHAVVSWTFNSVKSYGAWGDGVHDDTAAINSAISGGTAVYFPPGIYKYTGSMTLPANTSYRLYGDGPGVSTILFNGPTLGINGSNMGLATLNVEGLTLKANTLNCGTAIRGVFSESIPATKFRTATIHNVQIVGSTRTGATGTYWTNGIYLYKAQNAVIDKVEISGNNRDKDSGGPPTQTGIVWESSNDYATTGLQMSAIAITFANTALRTNGWVEGLSLFDFEFVLCGQLGMPAVDLNSIASLKPQSFHLYNGHVQQLENGIRATNVTGLKLRKLYLIHNIDINFVQPGSIIALNNCTDAIVSQCSFLGTGSVTPDLGIVLNNAHSVRIAGNFFAQFRSACIGIMSDSDVVHITDNLFGSPNYGTAPIHYDDQNPDPNDPYFRGNN